MKKKLSSPVISFKNVSFFYGNGNKEPALKNITFDLPPCSSLTIIGINGSGKTTMGKIMAGLLLHFKGEVKIFGKKLNEKNYQEITEKIGLVFQNPESQFIGENVEEDLAFGLENLNYPSHLIEEKIVAIAQKLKIINLLDRKPVTLSSGKKQKVAIASVLITDPKIIIFDEPTSLLDPQDELKIVQIIDQMKKEKKITVIEITHDIERITKSDLVMVVDQGKMIFLGSSQNLLQKNQHILDSITKIKFPFAYRLSRSLVKAKIIKETFIEEKKLLNALWKIKKL